MNNFTMAAINPKMFLAAKMIYSDLLCDKSEMVLHPQISIHSLFSI